MLRILGEMVDHLRWGRGGAEVTMGNVDLRQSSSGGVIDQLYAQDGSACAHDRLVTLGGGVAETLVTLSFQSDIHTCRSF
jgi:hypothetical protein